MAVQVRASRVGDGRALREIELWAGQRFREAGLDDVADHEPHPAEMLGEYAAFGRSWEEGEQTSPTAAHPRGARTPVTPTGAPPTPH